MKREQELETLEEMCNLMCGGTIIDSHKKKQVRFLQVHLGVFRS